jgi:putative colanic acid biosynthesis acetyltransferase WcaF
MATPMRDSAKPVTRPHRKPLRDVPQLGHDNVPVQSPWTLRQKIGRALWMMVAGTLFRFSYHNWYGVRRALLRLFGANIGKYVRVRPTAKIEIPWNLTIGDHSIIGDHAILYSLGKVEIGRRVVVSQYAHLCAGTHDFTDPNFPLIRPPITIEDEAWLAADSFVGPNVTVGRRTILGARSSAFKNLPPGKIAGGNPAKVLRDRDSADASQALPETDQSEAA